MIDLKTLSTEELHNLEKLIKKEKESRNKPCKASVYGPRSAELYDLVGALVLNNFGDVLTDTACDNNRGRLVRNIEASIFKLCDVAFVNLKPNSKGTLAAPGSDLYGVGEDFDAYKRMYDEITDVFVTYAERKLNDE